MQARAISVPDVFRWPEVYAERAEDMRAKEARLRDIRARQLAREQRDLSLRPAF